MIPLLVLMGVLAGDQALVPCDSGLSGRAHFVMVGRNRPPAEFEELGMAELRYAERDVLAMRAEAIRRMCFRPDEITVLVGDEATPDRVRAEIARHHGIERLFIYVTAHGSKERGIGLSAPMPWKELTDLAEGAKATQTMVFLDTCQSAEAAPRGDAKGASTLTFEPVLKDGYFMLTAAVHDTYERRELQAGEVTALFLQHVLSHERLDSQQLCENLRASSQFNGTCENTLAQRPVLIVPGRQALGAVEIQEPGAFGYTLFHGHGGVRLDATPSRGPPLASSERRLRRSRVAVGQYFVRRLHGDRCHRTDVFVVRPDEVHVIEPHRWVDDTGNCDYVRYGRIIANRPLLGVFGGFGASSGWLEGAGLEAVVRLGILWQPSPKASRLGLLVHGARTVRSAEGVDPEGQVQVQELGLAASADVVDIKLDEADFHGGIEAGAAWTRAEQTGLSGLAALRLGILLRSTAWMQPELSGRLGVRVHEEFGGRLLTTPWVGLVIGATYGWLEAPL
jgi:hypothetical protein